MDQEEKKIINEVADVSGLEVKDGLKIVAPVREEKKPFPGFNR